MLTGELAGRTETRIRVSLVAPDGRTFSRLKEAAIDGACYRPAATS